jgi:hypothetical protein
MKKLIWSDGFIEKWEDLASITRTTIAALIEEIDSACAEYRQSSGLTWPSSDFSDDCKIRDYFAPGIDLPIDWASTTSRASIGQLLGAHADRLSGPFSDVIRGLVADAPSQIQCECEIMFDKRLYKRCLQRSLLWRVQAAEAMQKSRYVYLPPKLVDQAVDFALSQQLDNLRTKKPVSLDIGDDFEMSRENAASSASFSAPSRRSPFAEDEFIEEIDLPPETTPIRSPTVKRPWTDPTTQNAVADPLLLEEGPAPPHTARKRQRREKTSKNLLESISYTKKLERLLGGDVKDMMIGNGKSLLSAALRGAPPLSPVD